jgi:hypothetical protein
MTERVNKYKKFIEEKSQTQHGIGTALKSTVSEAKELLKKTWNKIVPVGIRGNTPGGEEFIYYM